MDKDERKDAFIAKARTVHNNKYDYSLVEYVNAHKKVKILCPEHGVFEQNANNHLNGQGCPVCKSFKQRALKYGVGVFDYHKRIKRTDEEYKSYKKWSAILERCYSDNLKRRHPSYIGCSVCEEWRLYSKFKKWFDEHYIDGYSLDKDILFKNNKVYSPKTCCFVPQSINALFIKSDAKRGNYPIGVSRHSRVSYRAQMTINKKHVTIGIYRTVDEAFNAYKRVKEEYIKKVATQHFSAGTICQRVYDAMMNYEVSTTD